MGRIKSRFVKASGQKIYEKVKADVSEDFQKNKEVVAKYAQIPSKRMRNSVVGYVTRLNKQEAKEEA
jgi:small subunit ribosomal protein S17e